MYGDDVETQAHQQQGRAPLDTAGADPTTTTSHACLTRVKGSIHHVGCQTFDDWMSATQVQFAITHRQLKTRFEFRHITHYIAQCSGCLSQIELLCCIGILGDDGSIGAQGLSREVADFYP